MISAIVIIIGAIISATCQNLGAFMAGRFILAFGAAINFAAACAYLSELAYPTQRGASISMYMVVYFFGSIPASFICWRTSSIQGTLSWRLPIWLQVIVPTFVLVLSWAIPEVSMIIVFSCFDRNVPVLICTISVSKVACLPRAGSGSSGSARQVLQRW